MSDVLEVLEERVPTARIPAAQALAAHVLEGARS
jgi:hypothetical protein